MKNPSLSKNRLKIIQEKCRWTKGQSFLSSVTPVLYHKEGAQGVRREKAAESFKGKGGVPKNSPERRGPHTARVGHSCSRDAADPTGITLPVFSPLHAASVQISHRKAALHHSEAYVQQNLNYLLSSLYFITNKTTDLLLNSERWQWREKEDNVTNK